MTREQLNDFYEFINECHNVTMRESAFKRIDLEVETELLDNGESKYFRDLNKTINEYGQKLKLHSDFISEILKDIRSQKARLGAKIIK